ncbi:GbsR/MarR family transcriptional regulator [Fodinibius halophilus]|uniref:GbsR/MarR family transcriptional regulator n=1 Tax=Fodinibius halophilus TaxID=1736908 RepID=UPI003313A17A
MNSTRSETHEEALEQFVLLWGEMASAWGINKTMAQIHALLYAEADPLDTDTIMDQLDISRGNANMNLRNLLQWQLIHKVHFKGKRKDYFTAEKDVWTIVSTIIRERQQREVAPIRENLNGTLDLLEEKGDLSDEEQAFQERIENFTEFLEMFERFTEALLPYINKKNLKFLKHLVKLAEMKHSITGTKAGINPPSDSDE